MVTLELRHVMNRFGNVAALCDVSLTVQGGKFFVLVGPDDSGTTTLVKVVVGQRVMRSFFA